MSLYVDTDYWVEGYAEGDVVDEISEPRVLNLTASLSTTQQLTATVSVPAHSYTVSITSHTHEAG